MSALPVETTFAVDTDPPIAPSRRELTLEQEIELCYEQRDAPFEALARMEVSEFYREEDALTVTGTVVSIHKARKRGERRRCFRNRRRHHGSKVYVPERKTYLTAPNPRVVVSLPASAVVGLPPTWPEMEIATIDDDMPVADDDPEVDPLDGVDPDVLSLFEEVGEAVELPLGFHVEYGGGPLSRADAIAHLMRASMIEPDWGDPELWDLGRSEPRHLRSA